MRTLPSATLAIAVLLSSFASLTIDLSEANAQAYRRNRSEARGVFRGRNARFGGYHPGYGYGFNPYTPVITGNWYQRPYPHHFDYYRMRYSAPPTAPQEIPHQEHFSQ